MFLMDEKCFGSGVDNSHRYYIIYKKRMYLFTTPRPTGWLGSLYGYPFFLWGIMLKRSIIYIDGFNLYYGAIKRTNHKWLNLEKYFTLLRQGDDIQKIKYFSALVTGAHRQNQETYLRALETLPKMKIILGKFKDKTVKCLVKGCDYPSSRFFQMPEEKRTDVNIALNMYYDCINDLCDRFILVSGDSDLVPALKMIKECNSKKEIVVYVPANNPLRGAAVEIRNVANKDKTLPNELLSRCQFPISIPDGSGGLITKPAAW